MSKGKEKKTVDYDDIEHNICLLMQKIEIDDDDEKVDIGEELFQEHMLSFFQETKGMDDWFSYSAAYGEKDLVALAGQVYMKEVKAKNKLQYFIMMKLKKKENIIYIVNDQYGHDEATDAGINELFARAFSTYKKKGIMIEREKDGSYSFVNDSEVKQLLYSIISKRQDTLSISFGMLFIYYCGSLKKKGIKEFSRSLHPFY